MCLRRKGPLGMAIMSIISLSPVSVLFVLALASTWKHIEGHGFLLQPMSRSFVSFKFDPPDTRDYTPQGANAGGKQHVYDNGRLQWPNGRFGLCGEPWDKPVKRYEAPGRITAAYQVGSIIFIHLVITANHWGRMEFNLCPVDVTVNSFKQQCQVLQRADSKGPHWTLPPGELPDAQGRPLVPAFQDGSYSLYRYPEGDDFRDTPVFVVRYKLPDSFSCEHCMLHWYWISGNSCNPPCEPSDPLYPDCNRLQMGYCGQPKTSLPEEFWGCSDIRVGGQSPFINSSLQLLSDKLTAAEEAADRAGWAEVPSRPKASYWKAELLEQAERLDAAFHHHHSGGHAPAAAAAAGAPVVPGTSLEQPAALPADPITSAITMSGAPDAARRNERRASHVRRSSMAADQDSRR